MSGNGADRKTYIWVPSKLLDNSIVKVTCIAKEVVGDVEGVLESAESIIKEWDLRSLSEL
jgi:hypothetical protein